MPKPRPYQEEDVRLVLEAHKRHQCVLGRAATGLGKAFELAMLAEHYQKFGKVLILVDVKKLVMQLAGTVEFVTGVKPGIEMGERYANTGGQFSEPDRIIVSTVQTQYSGEKGRERWCKFQPDEFSAILLDETELFLADRAGEVVDWYRQNPDVKVFGTTATPMRSDGRAMANLFSHVAFDRDILWGIENGWLVPCRQAFVHVSLDFSKMKVNGDADDPDYNEEELARTLIGDETALIELAKGIVKVTENRKSIVVCPNVAAAKAIADYLCAEKPGQAKAIYGEMSDEEREVLFDAHQRGEFQWLSSCNLLVKGYDDPTIKCVVNCRKTRSKRLYCQILGRGTRPLKGIVDGPETAEDRKTAIAASDKPNMLMVNMVGIDASVRDITIADILGTADDAVRDRAKEIMLEDEGCELDEAIEQAEVEVAAAEEAAQMAQGMEQELLDKEDDDSLIRRARQRVNVHAHVDIEYEDGLGAGFGYETASQPKAVGGCTESQAKFIVYLSRKSGKPISFETAIKYAKVQAGAIITKLKGE